MEIIGILDGTRFSDYEDGCSLVYFAGSLTMPMKPEKADPEALAISALGFLASDEERLSRFLGVTGLTPQTLRKAAQDPGFLGAVLDYLVTDESILISFAANNGIDPARVADAAYRLHGSGAIGS